jgi:glucosylceramidase
MIRQFLTARDSGDRLTEKGRLLPSHDSSAVASLWINSAIQFQDVEGFGAAFTESAATTWLKLSPDKRTQVIRDYFSTSEGHGYSFCRVHMNSCDFSLGNYAHANDPNDADLSEFSIDRDRQALIPMIKAAIAAAGQPIKLLVSPWSPPAWMKTNGHMNLGGKLLPHYAKLWAQCFVRFVQEYMKEGVPVWGVSVQNEPAATQVWDSCIYSAEEERDFVRDHLGPAFADAGLDFIKIVIWDHNRDLMVERAGAIYADQEAARYVWGTGFHWYGEDHFDHVQLVHDAWPDKKLLFTEGCQEGGPHLGSWALGERYARSMINDLNRWTVGWIDWNLVLDESGGPNHVGNLCSAPILIDAKNDALLHQSSYYYIGHFARFARSGSRRVLCAASLQAIEATAFTNPDGTTVAIALNATEEAIQFKLTIDGQSVFASMAPRSISTYVSSPTN